MTKEDILNELKDSRKYTLHCHTQFCDGRSSMEEMTAKAIALGFTHIGFTPHSPIPIESPCNMKKADVNNFLKEINSLRKTTGGKNITILAGMEVDYISRKWNASSSYFQEIPLDYKISSIHFIPNQKGLLVDIDGNIDTFRKNMSVYFNNDIDYVVKKYIEKTHDMLEAGGFQIIGHFDKVSLNASLFSENIENLKIFNDGINEIIEHIALKGVIVEINTKAYSRHNRFFPHSRWWNELKTRSIPIIVNSDAHEANLLDASRDTAFDCLLKITDEDL